jgi:hypothetical protein
MKKVLRDFQLAAGDHANGHTKSNWCYIAHYKLYTKKEGI